MFQPCGELVSDLRKLPHKITKAESKAIQELKKLSQENFAYEADAIKALPKLSKQFKVDI